MLHGLNHPLEFPSVVWGFICLLMEDSRVVLDSLYQSVFVVGKVNVARREGRITRVVRSDGEFLPALENEETCSNPNKGEDLREQDTLKKQTKQQGPDTHIEQKTICYDLNKLPPAFLSEKDYPKGWLVYHPIYGVITREVSLELNKNG
jgi:hypothetical protein